jgi:hypothetical protein
VLADFALAFGQRHDRSSPHGPQPAGAGA